LLVDPVESMMMYGLANPKLMFIVSKFNWDVDNLCNTNMWNNLLGKNLQCLCII